MRKTVFLCLLALFVVSSCCFDDSQNLVSASMHISKAEKSLSADFSSGSSPESYIYCMQPCFTSGNITNPTSGTFVSGSGAFDNTVWTSIAVNDNAGNLGLCTPGVWDIKVRGVNKDNIVIYEGSVSSVYIQENTDIAVSLFRVFGKYDESGVQTSDNASVDIRINTVKVAETGTCAKYCIKEASSDNWGEETLLSTDNSYNEAGREGFKGTFDIEPGKYLLKISYYNGTSVVGSDVIAFMAFAKNTVNVTGSIDGAMFVSQGVTISIQNELTAVISEEDSVFTCTASGPVGGKYSYMWFINGIKNDCTASSLTFTETQQGLYDISCIVLWNSNTDSAITSTTYLFTV